MRKVLAACFIIGFAGYLAGYCTSEFYWREAFRRFKKRRKYDEHLKQKTRKEA